MQAEHSRTGGFIISPLCAPESIKKPQKASYKPIKVKRKRVISEVLARIRDEFYEYSCVFTKYAVKSALSTMVAVCAVMGFCNFFTLGTAVYHGDKPVAFTNEEKAYYTALSAAKSYAENYGESMEEFKTVPAIILRSKICTSTALRDKLLLASSSFSDACTLYSGSTPVFSAENENVAREVVSSYVSDYSMNGKASPLTNLTYKSCVVPAENVSGRDECRALLEENEAVRVVSVVNKMSEKVIPFETQTTNDSSLYVGDSVTVNEGKEGSSMITSEVVYENGAQVSSRVISESVTLAPVTRVVRVGTKTKDVLKEGLYEPLSGVVSSEFGKRWGRNHEGMDIAVPVGTPVKSAECGTVSFCGDAGTYGKLVKIDHGGGVVTAYAHLSEINVSVGQAVKANTQIALSGNTGRSTGPHLHFEVVKGGVPLNPRTYIKKR